MSQGPSQGPTVLRVEPLRFPFIVTSQRQAERGGYRELRTLGRWVARWHRRSLATLTRAPDVEYTDQAFDDFQMNRARYVVTIWCVPDGQAHGLPPRVDSRAMALSVIDGGRS